MIPRATYRLQFHKGFTFAEGAALAPYLAELGVSHLYSSPIATARAGSVHGYDVVDPTAINPELGGEGGFRAMAAALRRHGLGIILDIVPNHLAVGGSENRWWQDVLAQGRASTHAGLFDIDWDTPDEGLAGKLLAPFLGATYAETLAQGDLRLKAGVGEGLALAAYGVHRFPIRAEDHAEVFAAGIEAYDPTREDGRVRLHELLERQHFRLAWWRSAGDQINWRRFFEITELAGVRIETDAAFELIHALPLRLYAQGLIDGVRVDHVDGLADPGAYCRKLRGRLEALRAERRALGLDDPPYLIVEKILGQDEPLAPDWGLDGTTGYDFMTELGALLHQPDGAAPLAAYWAKTTGRPGSFEAEARPARTEILTRHFAGQLDAAARAFHRLALSRIETRDLALPALRRALEALITAMDVYRTYSTAEGLPEWDRPVLDQAIAAAKVRQPGHEHGVLHQISRWLQGRDGDPQLRGEAARRLQQLSAPVAAKAIEDTAFYRYGRLLSANEVGSDPGRMAASIPQTHAVFAARARAFPHALLATATHDHKRGEDARARLAVLSEVPDRWIERAERWRALNGLGAAGMEAGDELMLYQTLVGAWPYGLSPADAQGLGVFHERIWGWMEKALREAKLRSSWAEPDAAYEEACRTALERIADPERAMDFLEDIAGFVADIAPAGALNSLAQTLLRCTAPGAPDVYQGAEFWDLSLVDPDNRRPVDYEARRAALGRSAGPVDLLAEWRSGEVKQALIRRALSARARRPELFGDGEYLPLQIEGERGGSAFAFLRRHEGAVALTAVAIRCAEAVIGRATPLPAPEWWGDTRIMPPDFGIPGAWIDGLADAPAPLGGPIRLEELFATLPVALLLAA